MLRIRGNELPSVTKLVRVVSFGRKNDRSHFATSIIGLCDTRIRKALQSASHRSVQISERLLYDPTVDVAEKGESFLRWKDTTRTTTRISLLPSPRSPPRPHHLRRPLDQIHHSTTEAIKNYEEIRRLRGQRRQRPRMEGQLRHRESSSTNCCRFVTSRYVPATDGRRVGGLGGGPPVPATDGWRGP